MMDDTALAIVGGFILTNLGVFYQMHRNRMQEENHQGRQDQNVENLCKEVGALKKSVSDDYKKNSEDHRRIHEKIDSLDNELTEVKTRVAVVEALNKAKVGGSQ